MTSVIGEEMAEANIRAPVLSKMCLLLVALAALTEHHALKAYWGSGSIDTFVLDVSTRWR
jgi:hypothetical protein